MLHLAEFVAASLAVILLPGPGQIAILTATFAGGTRAGLRAVAGLLTGDIVIMTLVALGVATVFSLFPALLQVLRVAGSLYIGWIGIQVFRSSLASLTASPKVEGTPRWYARTVGITLLNPKAILFFLSFFPLFMDPSRGVLRSFLQMGALFTLLSGSYLTIFAWMGASLSRRLQASRNAGIWLPRALGAIILGFGIRLLAE